MKILLILLFPAILLGQSFKTTQYISTHGSDSVYRGSFEVGIYDSLFKVTDSSGIVMIKKLTKKRGVKYLFNGGYIKKAFDLDNKLYGYWMINKKCKKYYFFKKDW